MPIYTSRIDDNGNEIEKRHSARSLVSSINRLNLSSRSFDTKSSVRYVNSAAYIEKCIPLSEISSQDKFLSMSETQSDIVPPLDIQSEEIYPTPRDYTFSYRNHCEVAKIALKPDKAYETWLSAKRKLLSDEAARLKKSKEQKSKEIEERKRLAEENYKKWLKNKTDLQQQHSSQSSLKQQSNTSLNPVSSSKKLVSNQISDTEALARLQEWERVKRVQEERRRMVKRQEEERRHELEKQRRQIASEAWEKWLADAAKKPKPVPLNRGIFTLRGTIADIFVNPNEWQNITSVFEKENQ